MPSISVGYALEAVRQSAPSDPNAFSLEELKRSFKAADSRGRIRILKKTYAKLVYGVPFEIAEMAAMDNDSSVRAWLASSGRHLDYSPWREDHTRDTSNPELDLEIRLKNDPDEFVRACALSNGALYGYLGEATFTELIRAGSQLERLGLMQNINITPSLAADLYDLSKDFGITIEQRAELLEALLNNKHFIERTKYWEYEFSDNKMIWEAARKWPVEYRRLTMRTVERIDATNDTKIETYRDAPKELKLSILAGCANSRNQKLVEDVGLSEKDDDCREMAYAVIGMIDRKELEKIFKSKDKVALFGLARNRNLPRWMSRQIYKNIGGMKELHDEFGPDLIIRDLGRYISLDPETWASGGQVSTGKRAWIISLETLEGLFKLIVIGGALFVVNTPTESIIVAALALLYCKLDSSHSNLRLQVASLATTYHRNMLRIKRRLGITTDADFLNRKIGVDDDDDDAEKFLELARADQEAWTGVMVHSIFRGLTVLGSVAFLITKLLAAL